MFGSAATVIQLPPHTHSPPWKYWAGGQDLGRPEPALEPEGRKSPFPLASGTHPRPCQAPAAGRPPRSLSASWPWGSGGPIHQASSATPSNADWLRPGKAPQQSVPFQAGRTDLLPKNIASLPPPHPHRRGGRCQDTMRSERARRVKLPLIFNSYRRMLHTWRHERGTPSRRVAEARQPFPSEAATARGRAQMAPTALRAALCGKKRTAFIRPGPPGPRGCESEKRLSEKRPSCQGGGGGAGGRSLEEGPAAESP